MRDHPIAAAVCGLVLLGALIAIVMSQQLDKAKSLLRSERNVKSRLERSMSEKEEFLAERVEQNATLRQRLDEARLVNIAREEKRQKAAAAENAAAAAASQLRELQQKLREAAPGAKLGDLTFKDGAVLKNATIQKVRSDSIAFVHEGGIKTVMTPEMPDELVDRFGLIAPAPKKSGKTVASTAGGDDTASDEGTVDAPDFSTIPDVDLDPNQGNRDELAALISKLEERYTALSNLSAQKMSEAQSNWQGYYSARAVGRSSSQSGLAKKLEREAAILQAQMREIRIRIESARRAMR